MEVYRDGTITDFVDRLAGASVFVQSLSGIKIVFQIENRIFIVLFSF